MEINEIYWPDSLLLTNINKESLGKICKKELLSKVLNDMLDQGCCITFVDGYSYWDVTQFLEAESQCSKDEKVKIVYAFSMCNGIVVLDGKRIKGDANLISTLLQTERVSENVAQYLIDFGYNHSKGDDCKIE